MPKFLVKYHWTALCLSGSWAQVNNSGFVSQETTREEINEFVKEFAAERNDANTKLTNISIEEITPAQEEHVLKSSACWMDKTLRKMTFSAAEKFRQKC